MIVFWITIEPGVEGVKLSKEGSWGNLPYIDEEAARGAIEDDPDLKRHRHEIRVRRLRPLPKAAA